MNLKQKRAAAILRMQELSAVDEMTSEQIAEFDALEQEVRNLDVQITELEKRQERAAALVAQSNQRASQPERGAPGVLRHERGDNEATAWKAFFKNGDGSGLRHLRSQDEETGKAVISLSLPELRAVVDSNMNITTAADGGNMVPTGFSGQVALRKNELMLATKLGCRKVPGQGTTVNYPYESADPEVFPTVSEQSDAKGNNYEREGWPTALKAFTLVKKARRVELTEELLEDNAVALMDYISDRIGREMAKTHNTMLIAEAGANGTLLKTFASATAIAAGELEAIVGNDALGFYVDDASQASWVMRSSTHWAIKSLLGSNRLYAGMETGLLGSEVNYSTLAGPMTTGQKSVLFGVWDQMGYREAPELRFIQDPYSVDGLVILKYSFRAVYGVLQPAAIGYGTQL